MYVGYRKAVGQSSPKIVQYDPDKGGIKVCFLITYTGLPKPRAELTEIREGDLYSVLHANNYNKILVIT